MDAVMLGQMRKICLFLIIVFGVFDKSLLLVEDSSGASCTTSKNVQGTCILFESCPKYSSYNDSATLDNVYDLFENSCGINANNEILSCCPEEDLLPEPGVCGRDPTGGDRIVGGIATELGEYPWMVLIGYQQKGAQHHDFKCGGSLISDRYVLTAAHCVAPPVINQFAHVNVRLGEWNISAKIDCNSRECAAEPIDADIEIIHVHEDYDTKQIVSSNDIALIRLVKSVNFTDWISPICLPKRNITKNILNYNGTNMFVAGWGTTLTASYSAVKQKANVTVISPSKCNESYSSELIQNSFPNLRLDVNRQMCAGGEKNIDSCHGDSGGPLMDIRRLSLYNEYYYCAGIVSFGSSPCGEKDWPGIYTLVDAHMEWIRSKLLP